jgi:SAM-dependent methyltransferase
VKAESASSYGNTHTSSYGRAYRGVHNLIPYRSLLWDTYEALRLEPGMRVLDAGCGVGTLEHFIASKNPPQVTIDALEWSTGMLDEARRKCRHVGFVRFLAADLNGRLPFDDATFDRIVSLNVLHVLDDRDYVLEELLRVLKPDGRLVISSPLPTHNVAALISDHLRRIENVWGAHRKIVRLAESIWVFLGNGLRQWALSNAAADARQDDSVSHSLDESAFEALLRRGRNHGVFDYAITLASADQNLLATAWKRTPA